MEEPNREELIDLLREARAERDHYKRALSHTAEALHRCMELGLRQVPDKTPAELVDMALEETAEEAPHV